MTMTENDDLLASARVIVGEIGVCEVALERLRAMRDEMIRDAYREGVSIRQIAAAGLGISRSYIGEIVRDVER